MRKRIYATVAVFTLLLLLIVVLKNISGTAHDKGKTEENTNDGKQATNTDDMGGSPIKSSKPVSKNTPSLKELGTAAWISWLRTLPVEEQHDILNKIEASSYPSAVSVDEWKKAVVVKGPGQDQNDVFPCKILTDYKALLRPRMGLGVVGLQFLINRDGDSILTTIWSQNAKDAITVDWANNKIIPAFNMQNIAGSGVAPSASPYGLHIHGDDGKLAVSNVLLPWRTGVLASPLAVHKDSPVWFGDVYTIKPRQLESIVCIDPTPPKLLGEIKMPAGKSLIWCLFDVDQKVLLIVDHSWEWIAMIDFSTPQKLDERKN